MQEVGVILYDNILKCLKRPLRTNRLSYTDAYANVSGPLTILVASVCITHSMSYLLYMIGRFSVHRFC